MLKGMRRNIDNPFFSDILQHGTDTIVVSNMNVSTSPFSSGFVVREFLSIVSFKKSSRAPDFSIRLGFFTIVLFPICTIPMEEPNIHVRRDSRSSIAYSEELISATMSATFQSMDRHDGIVGQECCHFQRDL